MQAPPQVLVYLLFKLIPYKNKQTNCYNLARYSVADLGQDIRGLTKGRGVGRLQVLHHTNKWERL